jgi:hypothetical protein
MKQHLKNAFCRRPHSPEPRWRRRWPGPTFSSVSGAISARFPDQTEVTIGTDIKLTTIPIGGVHPTSNSPQRELMEKGRVSVRALFSCPVPVLLLPPLKPFNSTNRKAKNRAAPQTLFS